MPTYFALVMQFGHANTVWAQAFETRAAAITAAAAFLWAHGLREVHPYPARPYRPGAWLVRPMVEDPVGWSVYVAVAGDGFLQDAYRAMLEYQAVCDVAPPLGWPR